eukprot:gene24249-44946_t
MLPALVLVGTFQVLAAWNDYLGPLIFLNDESMYTLTLGLARFKTLHDTNLTALAAMTIMFVIAVMVITPAEQAGNPLFTSLGVDQVSSALQAGGNMEGKELRFGIDASSLFAAVTTAASCGAVNAMHDSLTPLGGMVPMVLMQLGEVVFGGVGSGLYGMLIF